MSKSGLATNTTDTKDLRDDFVVPEYDTFDPDAPTPEAEVVIRGKNVEVPAHFSQRIAVKLARLERMVPKIQRFEVELRHEPNPRQGRQRDRVEITVRGKGAPARAEAAEDSFYAALEKAIDKLEGTFRKIKTKRLVSRRGHRTPVSVAEATGDIPEALLAEAAGAAATSAPATEAGSVGAAQGGKADVDPFDENVDPYAHTVADGPGQIVRTKVHSATPISVDEALYEMELVGHDFYLFHNAETGKPSVVYRRHAFDYGLISLGE